MRQRLKHLATLSAERRSSERAPVLTLDLVESGTGRVVRDAWNHATEPPDAGIADVEPGDVLFGKLRPYLAKAALAERSGYASTELLCLRPNLGVDPRWLLYTMLSKPVIDWAIATSEGTKMPRTSWEDLGCLGLSVPTETRQRRIADFLDGETARIDALIAKKRRLGALFQERFNAWTDRVLTSQAKALVRLMHLTDPHRPIVYGIVQAGPETTDGVPYIKTGDLGVLRLEALSRTAPAIDAQYSRSRVHPGDIVVAMRASIGQAVMIPDGLPRANLTQGTARIAPARGVDGVWLHHALRTSYVQEQCQVRAVGATFRTLNIWDLRRLPIPFVSLSEQQRAARSITIAQQQLMQLRQDFERQTALLQERRQALITAAVTGELDIPGAAA